MIPVPIGKTTISKGFSRGYGYILLLCFCLTLSGCYLGNQPGKNYAEIKTLKSGETAFFKEEYTRADEIFTLIANQSKDPGIQNIARYNLACTKLIQSETQEKFTEAMALLSQWHPVKSANNPIENPLLVIQTLKKIADANKKYQLEILEKNQAMDTLLKKENTKICQLEKLIKTLQYQISELENIDQEIQEKRKAN